MSSPETAHDTLSQSYPNTLASHEIVADEIVFQDLGNQELAIYDRKAELIDAMNNNQVVIVISPTGTGKSTQIPQYAMEAGFNPVRHTQPRRRAAHNVASRIQEELGLTLGEDNTTGLVSCQTGSGLIGEYDARTQVTTEGVRRIRDTYEQSDGDNELLILDEVHEASLEMWMLEGFAKEKLADNPNFTVVVMTATIDKYKTIESWTNAAGIEPAVIELSGGTNFDIEHREEPESTTAREAVKAAIEISENPDGYDGANTIQIFEDGKRSIKDTMDEIHRSLPAEVRAKSSILANHAKMTPQAQQPVYEDFEGIKIVAQTNIGKTSMTIPRTRYVITSGEERIPELDEAEDVEALRRLPSTQDDLTQEKGRGGRTTPSIFIHTRHAGREFVPLADRDPHRLPEILRSKIDSVVMALALRGRRIRDFPGDPMPPEARIDRAIHRLQILGVLDDKEEITKLGIRMGKYPASPEHARALVEAENHGVQVRLCMAAMVASAEVGGLRLFEQGSAPWEAMTGETSSDLFAQLEMFINIKRKRVNEMTEQDLDKNNIIRADELYRKIAHRSGIEDIPVLKVPSAKDRLILRECIVRGFANSAYLPQGEGMFRAVGNVAVPREISRRSVVKKNTQHAVVGKPFNIEIESEGVPSLKPILEQVTEVPVRELGKYVTDLTVWEPTNFRQRGGKFVQVQRQLLGRRVLGTRELPAEPSPALRAAVIEQVKVQPGKHLRELYGIKSELEKLARRSKIPIPVLTQDMIDDYIKQAAPPDVDSTGHIDENLRKLIEEKGISIDQFVGPEQRTKILKDAPDEINVDGYSLKLRYNKGKPTAVRVTIDMILGIENEPMLADGRQVMFVYDGKKHTLQQLRKRLRSTGEL